VCISSFDNPYADVGPAAAESAEFKALGISTVASTIASASPIATGKGNPRATCMWKSDTA